MIISPAFGSMSDIEKYNDLFVNLDCEYFPISLLHTCVNSMTENTDYSTYREFLKGEFTIRQAKDLMLEINNNLVNYIKTNPSPYITNGSRWRGKTKDSIIYHFMRGWQRHSSYSNYNILHRITTIRTYLEFQLAQGLILDCEFQPLFMIVGKRENLAYYTTMMLSDTPIDNNQLELWVNEKIFDPDKEVYKYEKTLFAKIKQFMKLAEKDELNPEPKLKIVSTDFKNIFCWKINYPTFASIKQMRDWETDLSIKYSSDLADITNVPEPAELPF